jgi:hypothetical protein
MVKVFFRGYGHWCIFDYDDQSGVKGSGSSANQSLCIGYFYLPPEEETSYKETGNLEITKHLSPIAISECPENWYVNLLEKDGFHYSEFIFVINTIEVIKDCRFKAELGINEVCDEEDYHSSKLKILLLASREWWSSVTEDDATTHPKKKRNCKMAHRKRLLTAACRRRSNNNKTRLGSQRKTCI